MTTSTEEQERAATASDTCPVCGGEDGEHTLQQQELDCPDCLERAGIHSKMGTKRYDCKRCNRYAQRLIRASARRLQDEHPEHYEALRKEAEVEMYIEDTAGE